MTTVRKRQKKKGDTKDGRKCLKCAEAGQIARNGLKKNDMDEAKSDRVGNAMVTAAHAALWTIEKFERPNKWMVDSTCSRQASGNRSHFSEYLNCKAKCKVVTVR